MNLKKLYRLNINGKKLRMPYCIILIVPGTEPRETLTKQKYYLKQP